MLAHCRTPGGYDNMPIVRVASLGGLARHLAPLLAGVVVSVTLWGCANERLSSEPAAGVSLAGSWKLDHSASDDPQKLLAQMRTQALKVISRRQAARAAQATMRGGGRQD